MCDRVPWFRFAKDAPEVIPSAEILRDLIESVFWASLLREEGRELRFTIRYVRSVSDELPFKTPIDFTLDNLRKLAPALARVEVGVIAADGSLKIAELSNRISGPLAIKVLDPGLVIVSLYWRNIAVISGKEAAFINNALVSRNHDIWSVFSPNGEDFGAFSNPRVKVVIKIAKEMRISGHGGALMIISRDARIGPSIAEIRYKVDEINKVASQPLQDFIESGRKLKANKEDKVAKAMERFSEKQLESSVPEFIAQLTLVDGATLLCPDLDVLGFGVRLKSANDPPPRIVVIDPREGKTEVSLAFDDFHRGTRHKSAAQFVFDNRGSIAIVASQDGNVTAFVWRTQAETNADCLHAFERLELSLF